MEIRAICAVLLLFAAAGAPAEPATPRREMSTDRPDKTESPYTVPGGMFQIEADLLARTRDRSGSGTTGIITRSTAVGTVNLKRGLDHDTDIQFVFAPYLHQRISDRAAGTVTRASGVGDLTVRVKRNVWGNDDGGTALAVMPFVTLPTSTNGLGTDHVEAGIIVPLGIALSDRLGLGLMTEIDFVRDPDGSGYAASFINSATLGADLTSRLGMYVELFTEKAPRTDWIATFDAGLTFAVTDDLQLDGGANLGLTDTADDLTVFIGISHRF